MIFTCDFTNQIFILAMSGFFMLRKKYKTNYIDDGILIMILSASSKGTRPCRVSEGLREAAGVRTRVQAAVSGGLLLHAEMRDCLQPQQVCKGDPGFILGPELGTFGIFYFFQR